MKYDVVVAGGGLGGLTAGAILAKRGKKVLLVEKHNVVGGCAVTFRRKDLLVEATLHEMDGLDKNDIKPAIINELGISSSVEFIRVPEFYRVVKGSLDFVMPDNVEAAAAKLIKQFPREHKGIEKFFRVISDMGAWMATIPMEPWRLLLRLPFYFPFWYYHIFRYMKKDVGSFVDSIISDEDLKLILMANVGYYHDDPYELGMVYYGVAQGSYFSGGGHYIKGGSQQLSNAMAKVITDNGGEVLTRNEVTRVVLENGRATGVKYRKTSKTHPERHKEIFAEADVVIANLPLPNLINHMMPDYRNEKFKARMGAMALPGSATIVFLGFSRPLKGIGNKCYSTFVCGDTVDSIKQIKEDSRNADYKSKSYAFVEYGMIDSGLAPEGKSVGSIAIGDDISNWEGLSREEYKAKKDEVARIFIDRLDKLVPGAKELVIYSEVATPVTIKRYTGNPKGVFYGFAQTVGQDMMSRPISIPGVDNLLISSAWGLPGGGLSGVIIGGNFCADKARRILDKK
ncbi:MAG: NAD(P)/FAD-dependent oxidoreductase [Nitrospinae bacterium]|nr:NAD(P)/FAD-dependent oxidoreductase [Nitrospinota bacterium]